MSAKHDIKTTQAASALLLLSFIIIPTAPHIYKETPKKQQTEKQKREIKNFFRYEKWPRQYIWR